jgi:hypothetical protein
MIIYYKLSYIKFSPYNALATYSFINLFSLILLCIKTGKTLSIIVSSSLTQFYDKVSVKNNKLFFMRFDLIYKYFINSIYCKLN